jgi:hypothetical protein
VLQLLGVLTQEEHEVGLISWSLCCLGDRDGDEMATVELRNLLSRRGTEMHHVTGASPDLSHCEPGFAVRGLTLEEALEIG